MKLFLYLYYHIRFWLSKVEYSSILVSIIIPVYNGERYLQNMLNNIRKQSYKNLEIIFINDCSSDTSAALLQKFQQIDPKIVVVSSRHHLGPGGARNLGMAQAQGKYLLFHDVDDVLKKHAINRLLKFALWTQSEIISGVSRVQSRNRIRYRKSMKKTWEFNLNFNNRPHYALAYTKNISLCNKLFLRTFFDHNKIKFIHNRYFEDSDFWIKAMFYVQNISYCPFIISTYRYNKNSFSRSSNNLECKLQSIVAMYDDATLFFSHPLQQIYLFCLNSLILKGPLAFTLQQIYLFAPPVEQKYLLVTVQNFLLNISDAELLMCYKTVSKRLALKYFAIKYGNFFKAKQLRKKFFYWITMIPLSFISDKKEDLLMQQIRKVLSLSLLAIK